jgi:cytochrome c oxidase subunit 3
MTSDISLARPPEKPGAPDTREWPIELNRGTYAVWTVIVTEAALFVCFFASYYFLGNDKDRWAIDTPPKLTLALIMLAVLVSSSFVMMFGERMVKQQRFVLARISVFVTVAMGVGFLVIQAFEYKDHWKTLTPFSDSYGSIFYTIVSFHAAHVLVGILMLCYLGILPTYGPSKFPPHRPFHVVTLYWHFVDAIWIFVVLLLYVIPHFQVLGR